MIEYWEFMVVHQDGGKEWISPAINLELDGFLIKVYNGFGTWEYDIREILSWSLDSIHKEVEDV